MLIEETEYQGKPLLSIKNDESDRWPFSFGLVKAKKILSALDEIKAFVDKYDKPADEPKEPPAKT